MVKRYNRIVNIALVLSLIVGMLTMPVGAITYSNDEVTTAEWYHDYIDTQEAWDLIDEVYPDKRGRERVKIATIDSGCDRYDSDLGINLDTEHFVRFSTLDGMSATPYYTVNVAHGTKMARLIAATSNDGIGHAGVAAGNNNDIASLMAIHVYSDSADRYGDKHLRYTTTDDIIAALNYAAEKGAQVIHMCLGHNKKTQDASGSKFDDERLQQEIKRIVQEYDIVIVASAGNQANVKAWNPSDMEGVLGIINTRHYTNIKSKRVKAHSSSYGKNKFCSAPGNGSGTSGASAIAAGVVALVRYANPDLNAEQVVEVLKTTTTDLFKKGRDNLTGYGNVNAYAAVAKALNAAGYEGFPNEIAPATCNETVVKLTAKSKDHKNIKLKWKAVKSVSGTVNGYKILRADKKNGKYIRIATVEKTKYIDKKCKKGKRYFYKVQPFGTTYDGKVMKPISAETAKVVSAKA